MTPTLVRRWVLSGQQRISEADVRMMVGVNVALRRRRPRVLAVDGRVLGALSAAGRRQPVRPGRRRQLRRGQRLRLAIGRRRRRRVRRRHFGRGRLDGALLQLVYVMRRRIILTSLVQHVQRLGRGAAGRPRQVFGRVVP